MLSQNSELSSELKANTNSPEKKTGRMKKSDRDGWGSQHSLDQGTRRNQRTVSVRVEIAKYPEPIAGPLRRDSQLPHGCPGLELKTAVSCVGSQERGRRRGTPLCVRTVPACVGTPLTFSAVQPVGPFPNVPYTKIQLYLCCKFIPWSRVQVSGCGGRTHMRIERVVHVPAEVSCRAATPVLKDVQVGLSFVLQRESGRENAASALWCFH